MYTITAKNIWGKASTKVRLVINPIPLPLALRFSQPHGYTTFVKTPMYIFNTGEVIANDAPVIEPFGSSYYEGSSNSSGAISAGGVGTNSSPGGKEKKKYFVKVN